MKLTEENKRHIDSMPYEQLLSTWRFAPAGDLWFQGETGEYWGVRMAELRPQNALLADFHSLGIEGADRVFVASHHGDCMTAREPLQKMMDRSPAFAVWHTDEELARLIDALSHIVPLRVGRRKPDQEPTRP